MTRMATAAADAAAAAERRTRGEKATTTTAGDPKGQRRRRRRSFSKIREETADLYNALIFLFIIDHDVGGGDG